jgi:hypothetical protein
MVYGIPSGGYKCPFLAEAVEKVGHHLTWRNDRIKIRPWQNHSCSNGSPRESILRVRPFKILFQQPQPEEDIKNDRPDETSTRCIGRN